MIDFFSYVYSFFYTAPEVKPEGDNDVEIIEHIDKTSDLINMVKNNESKEKIVEFLKENPIRTLDFNRKDADRLNLIQLSIIHGCLPLFIRFFDDKIYTPDELRAIKNSKDHNLVTICRLNKRDDYSYIIRNYVKNYS